MDKYSFDRFIKQKNQKSNKDKIIRYILSFFILSAVSYIFIQFGFFKENNTLYYIFIGILATAVAYLNGYFKRPTQELNGYFDGKITFKKEGIEIGIEKYAIENIHSITIHNNDFVGKKELEHGEFEKEDGSLGVDNQLIIDLGKRNFVETDFKQKTENEFIKMKSILIEYHLKHKMTFDDLVNIMHLEYDIDKNELKKAIDKRR